MKSTSHSLRSNAIPKQGFLLLNKAGPWAESFPTVAISWDLSMVGSFGVLKTGMMCKRFPTLAAFINSSAV
jgi:hypothetical protein